jgi:hypothetical protein
MAEQTEKPVLEMLRRICGSQVRTEQDIADLRTRMSAVEERIGRLTIAVGHVHTQIAGLNKRMDRFDERLARVVRRLDLVEA